MGNLWRKSFDWHQVCLLLLLLRPCLPPRPHDVRDEVAAGAGTPVAEVSDSSEVLAIGSAIEADPDSGSDWIGVDWVGADSLASASVGETDAEAGPVTEADADAEPDSPINTPPPPGMEEAAVAIGWFEVATTLDAV